MPSCMACGRWYSEEDSSCGCSGETVVFTRAELRKFVEQCERVAKVAVLWQAADVARRMASVDGNAVLSAAELNEMAERVKRGGKP